MSRDKSVVPGAGFEYYQGHYWNDLQRVRDLLNERCTGDSARAWQDHLLAEHGPFERALILNCGNGWVERELVDRGLIGSGVGVDYSENLLAQARSAAAAAHPTLEYRRCDTNTADFPDGEFDLVVNHAAMHHVAYVDRVMRAICELLPSDGVFVSYDYVGPHRNQYTAAQWEAAWLVNESLPAELRQTMAYPSMTAMLADDPTEAVHSELVMSTMRRYFAIDYEARLGGALAYPLADPQRRAPLVSRGGGGRGRRVDHGRRPRTVGRGRTRDVLRLRGRPTGQGVTASALTTSSRWADEENAREAAAAAAGGLYYPPTMLSTLERQIAEAGRNPVLARLPPSVAARLSQVEASCARRREAERPAVGSGLSGQPMSAVVSRSAVTRSI